MIICIISPPSHDSPGVPGICQDALGRQGFFVPYQQEQGEAWLPEEIRNRWQTFIRLSVHDLSWPVSRIIGNVPFLIDEGSPVTIIPKHLVPDCFPENEAVRVSRGIEINMLSMKIYVYHIFRAVISIVPATNAPSNESLSFGERLVLVPDISRGKLEYGLLGLNALRRVERWADAEYAYFWPPSA